MELKEKNRKRIDLRHPRGRIILNGIERFIDDEEELKQYFKIILNGIESG